MEEYEFKERLVIIGSFKLIAAVVFVVMNKIMELLELQKTPEFLAVNLIYLIIVAVISIVLHNFKGLVRADQNGVYIKILLFGIKISEHNYGYSDVTKADCIVETHIRKKSYDYSDMVVVFLFAGNKKLCFSKRLKIRCDLEKKDPSAYYAAVSSDPMARLGIFVEETKKRIFYEKHPEMRETEELDDE